MLWTLGKHDTPFAPYKNLKLRLSDSDMLDIPQVADGRTRIHTQAHLSPSSGGVPEGGRGMPRRLGTARRVEVGRSAAF